jgi:hypothetical protein
MSEEEDEAEMTHIWRNLATPRARLTLDVAASTHSRHSIVAPAAMGRGSYTLDYRRGLDGRAHAPRSGSSGASRDIIELHRLPLVWQLCSTAG